MFHPPLLALLRPTRDTLLNLRIPQRQPPKLDLERLMGIVDLLVPLGFVDANCLCEFVEGAELGLAGGEAGDGEEFAAGGGVVVGAGDEVEGFDAVAVEVEDAGVAHGGEGKGLVRGFVEVKM